LARLRATIASNVPNLEDSERKRILCVECSREPLEGLRGWRAYLTTDEDEPADTVVYCPTCASGSSEPRPKTGMAFDGPLPRHLPLGSVLSSTALKPC